MFFYCLIAIRPASGAQISNAVTAIEALHRHEGPVRSRQKANHSHCTGIRPLSWIDRILPAFTPRTGDKSSGAGHEGNATLNCSALLLEFSRDFIVLHYAG